MQRNVPLFDLFKACDQGSIDVVKNYLASCHPDDGCTDFLDNTNFGMTALMLACKNGHTNIVEAILNYRKNALATQRGMATKSDLNAIDSRTNNALTYAAAGGHLDICQLLIAHGADPRNADNQHNTPADYAATNGHSSVATYLRKSMDAFNKTPAAENAKKIYRLFQAPPTPVFIEINQPTERVTRSAAKKRKTVTKRR